jgi:hypothetical protein
MRAIIDFIALVILGAIFIVFPVIIIWDTIWKNHND